MAINKKLIHFKKKETFDSEYSKGNILGTSIVFIQDANTIWTHGTYYPCPYSKSEIDSKFSDIAAGLLRAIDVYISNVEPEEPNSYLLWVNLDNNVLKYRNPNYNSEVSGSEKWITLSSAEGGSSITVENNFGSSTVNPGSQALVTQVNTKVDNLSTNVNNLTTNINGLDSRIDALEEAGTVEYTAGNGLSLTDSKFAVKLANSNEKYLEVTTNGLASKGIDDAISASTPVVNTKDSGHVRVDSTSAADGHKIYTISENDIASASALSELNTTVSDLNTKVNNLNIDSLQSLVDTNTAAIDEINRALNSNLNSDNLVVLSYNDLKAKVNASTLIPGVKYAINDYICAYILPETNIEKEDSTASYDFRYIVCTAISNNRLSYDVDIIRDFENNINRVTIISAKYSIDPNFCTWTRNMTKYKPTGVIFYLEDSNGNKAYYDFKHIKFRRWAIKNITANTTVDSGSNTNTSPFRGCVTDNTRPTSDTRQFVGAGDPDEINYVKAIFDGTWKLGGQTTPAHNYNTMTLNSGLGIELSTYHQDYITQVLKPYLDTTNYPRDKYLAWQTDMYAKQGLSARGAILSDATWMGGMSNVEVDPNDYKDMYTFDCDGEDLSEYVFTKSNGQKASPVMYNLFIGNSNYPILEQYLPNIVFNVSKNCLPNLDGSSTSVLIIDNKFPSTARKNTFLMRAFYNGISFPWCLIRNNDFGILFQYNLCLVNSSFSFNTLYFSEYNFLNGNFQYVQIKNLARNNVMIGYFSKIDFKSTITNLLFGDCVYDKTINDNTFKLSEDGTYWYNTIIDDWFGSNIISPFLYSKLGNHINANTFTSVYNKGASLNKLMYNTIGCLKWGTTFGYGAFDGCYIKGQAHVTVPPLATAPASIKNAKGIYLINPENKSKAIPTLSETDWEISYPAQAVKICETVNDISTISDGWVYPTDCNRRKLYCSSDGTFKLVSMRSAYENDTNTVSLMSTEDTLSDEEVRKMYEEMYSNEFNDYDPYINSRTEPISFD